MKLRNVCHLIFAHANFRDFLKIVKLKLHCPEETIAKKDRSKEI